MCAPGQHQPDRIAKVMAGIGEQRHRLGNDAIDDLDHDQGEVERGCDCKSAAEVRRRVGMGIPGMGVGMRVPRMRMAGVIVRHAIPPSGNRRAACQRFGAES